MFILIIFVNKGDFHTSTSTPSTSTPSTSTSNHKMLIQYPMSSNNCTSLVAFPDLKTSSSVLIPSNNVYSLVDVFPSVIINKPPKFASLERLKINIKNAFPCILIKDKNSRRICYYKSPVMTMDEINCKQLLKLLKKSTNSEVVQTNNQFFIDWKKLDSHYKSPPLYVRQQHQQTTSQYSGRTDHRSVYRFDNMFVVNSYFTFGERKTRINECHVIQTLDAPLLYSRVKPYFVTSFHKLYYNSFAQEFLSRDRKFNWWEQQYFETFILEPFSNYVVPINTIYVLMSPQKSVFSVDRIYEHVVEKMLNNPNWEKQQLKKPDCLENLVVQEKINSIQEPHTVQPKRSKLDVDPNDGILRKILTNVKGNREWYSNDELELPRSYNVIKLPQANEDQHPAEQRLSSPAKKQRLQVNDGRQPTEQRLSSPAKKEQSQTNDDRPPTEQRLFSPAKKEQSQTNDDRPPTPEFSPDHFELIICTDSDCSINCDETNS